MQLLIYATFALGVVQLGRAMPSYQAKVPNGARVACPSGATGCNSGLCQGIGHTSCAGGGERNAFGLAFAEEGYAWTSALCRADSDGDGFSNGEELGDPCCVWRPGDTPSHGINSATHPGMASGRPSEHTLGSCAAPQPPRPGSNRPADAFLPNEPQFQAEFRLKPYSLPAVDTTYVWAQFDFPQCENESCYIIGMDILVDNALVLHHIIATMCPERSNASKDGVPQDQFSDCPMWLAEWAPGRDPMLSTPEFASIPIGKSVGQRVGSFMLQMHYSNPLLRAGETDHSGVRLYYTNKPRAQPLGELIAIQLSSDGSVNIPPKRNRNYLGSVCEVRGLVHPITITDLWFHAHLLGREFHAFIQPADGSQRFPFYRDARWSFENQYAASVLDRNITLRNGDRIATIGVYNSTERVEHTVIGLETTDEMFWHAMMYYPLQSTAQCVGGLFRGDLEPCEDPEEVVAARLAVNGGLIPYERFNTRSVHACEYSSVKHLDTSDSLEDAFSKCGGRSVEGRCMKLWYGVRYCSCPDYPGTDAVSEDHRKLLESYSTKLLDGMDPCLSSADFASLMGCTNPQVGYAAWSLQSCDYALNFTKPFHTAYETPQACVGPVSPPSLPSPNGKPAAPGAKEMAAVDIVLFGVAFALGIVLLISGFVVLRMRLSRRPKKISLDETEGESMREPL